MTTAVDDKEAEKARLKARSEAMEAEEKSLNEGRTGKGTRAMVGMTRGKNPQKVTYEAFDESQPDTCPKSLSEFMDIAKVSDETTIVSYLIDGFNSAQYTAASDPIAEFVNPVWDDKVKSGFRLVVRNFASNNGISIDDAVALIKPAYEASQKK